MALNLRRLGYLVVLAEELNFTRAAARLHIAQPALSQQIRQLEKELGAELVVRRRTGCALTEIGELVVAEGRDLTARVDAATARIQAAVQGRSGRIRLAYTRSARGGAVDALIARYRERFPDVEVLAETGWTALNVAGLLAGRLDLAFVRPPIEEAGIVCCSMEPEELLLALPEGHPLARLKLVARERLVGEPVVMWPRENGPGMYDRTVEQVWPNGGFNHARYEPDDEQLLRAVASGGVIAVVPAGRARALPMPGVRLRRFRGPTPTVGLALAYRPEHLPAAGQDLLDLLYEK
ncbi:LysR family transcriptional regulator [Kineosporia babensis]|uniref:LysR substrate-binding domain-containing protein n=1 Tax=Kineosporia babensis TaxID=499548 RepID=A0A9X1N9F0_9ACTN|nr:LysR substrate-binding domain-containing protein [Kineosporia babensis]MCD5310982.1 LysR substrate-binding domain-containing protein [Kineosporia babensis]